MATKPAEGGKSLEGILTKLTGSTERAKQIMKGFTLFVSVVPNERSMDYANIAAFIQRYPSAKSLITAIKDFSVENIAICLDAAYTMSSTDDAILHGAEKASLARRHVSTAIQELISVAQRDQALFETVVGHLNIYSRSIKSHGLQESMESTAQMVQAIAKTGLEAGSVIHLLEPLGELVDLERRPELPPQYWKTLAHFVTMAVTGDNPHKLAFAQQALGDKLLKACAGKYDTITDLRTLDDDMRTPKVIEPLEFAVRLTTMAPLTDTAAAQQLSATFHKFLVAYESGVALQKQVIQANMLDLFKAHPDLLPEWGTLLGNMREREGYLRQMRDSNTNVDVSVGLVQYKKEEREFSYEYFNEVFKNQYAKLPPNVRTEVQMFMDINAPVEMSIEFDYLTAAVSGAADEYTLSTLKYLVGLKQHIIGRFQQSEKIRSEDFYMDIQELFTPSFLKYAGKFRDIPPEQLAKVLQEVSLLIGRGTLHSEFNQSDIEESERRREQFYAELEKREMTLETCIRALWQVNILNFCPTSLIRQYMKTVLETAQKIDSASLPRFMPESATQEYDAKYREKRFTPEVMQQYIKIVEQAGRLAPSPASVQDLMDTVNGLQKDTRLSAGADLFEQAGVIAERLQAKGIAQDRIRNEIQKFAAVAKTPEGRIALQRRATLDTILAPYLQEKAILAEHATALSVYATGLTGTNVSIEPLDFIASSKHLQTSALARLVQAEEHVIRLPREIDVFPTRTGNEQLYKMLATIGIGLIRYDTLHVDTARLAAIAAKTPYTKEDDAAKTSVDAYLAAFPQPELAKLVFSAIEYLRVGVLLQQQYPGIRKQLQQMYGQLMAMRTYEEMQPGEKELEQAIDIAMLQKQIEPAPLAQLLASLTSGTPSVEDTLHLVPQIYDWLSKSTAYGEDTDGAGAAQKLMLAKRSVQPKGTVKFMLPDVTITKQDSKAVEYPEFDIHRGHYANTAVVHVQSYRSTPNREVERILKEDAGIIARLKQQYLELHPTGVQMVKGLYDGELDEDRYFDYVSDLEAGIAPDERIYKEKIIHQSSKATLFLVDASASTNKFLGEWRVVDYLMKALVYFTETLKDSDEQYGISAYSGKGREHVMMYTLKDIEEPFSAAVYDRIGNLSGMQRNRDGAGIRHAVARLKATDAGTKRLIIFSDGLPDDIDSYEGAYALEDTKRARQEAETAGIQPFCFCLNPEKVTTLQDLWGQGNFVHLDDATRLPELAPGLYLRMFAK